MATRIALTGGIASGKSAVADLLARHGAVIIDSDVLAREVVALGTPGLDAIAERFGPGVLAADGSLDRAALGRIVFADPEARTALEGITHPAIRERSEWLREHAPEGAIVIDVIPLLVEAGLAERYDTVIVVDADEDTQLRRLMARSGLTREEAELRIAAQASRRRRRTVADEVVVNDGDRAELEARVDALWQRLRAREA
ncbi:MAG TPA: dephospho-CoA kinase [Propioniciclava sp.]|uniref:dephospho-CoA kinase n=1 Tax=Propioniciclava sp. TaxID=2038686 RepID=UPI002BC97B96|nr:dephospho-CoA kinase [Propioniciclava sp.]HRL50360.1 dephospho-CoA kinase [Propioniciclava sp.]HRL78787.1 dephospho-CoA kinase [Propioniciclava sp.]